MGARLTDPRWFRSQYEVEKRLLLHGTDFDKLTDRHGHLNFLESLGLLSPAHWVELYQVREEIARRIAENIQRERCPVCGGWRHYPRWHREQGKDGKPYKSIGLIPCCRDCGWPHAEDIHGSNVIHPGPRFGFRVTPERA